MEFDALRPVKIITTGLKLIGVWKLKGFSQYFYKIYTFIAFLIFTATIASYLINLFLVEDLEILISCLYIFLTIVGCYSKALNILVLHRQNYFNFASSMKDLDFYPYCCKELLYFKKEYKSFNVTIKSYIIGPIVVLLLAYLTPLITSEYMLPYPCWFPFNWKTKENYWYAYGAVVCGMNHVCFVCVFLDLFHMFILCYVALIYKLVNYRMEKLSIESSKQSEFKNLVKLMIFHRKVQK